MVVEGVSPSHELRGGLKGPETQESHSPMSSSSHFRNRKQISVCHVKKVHSLLSLQASWQCWGLGLPARVSTSLPISRQMVESTLGQQDSARSNPTAPIRESSICEEGFY